MAGIWLVAADDELYGLVRQWARGDLRESEWSAPFREGRASTARPACARTLFITTPEPWRCIVAVAQAASGRIRPLLVPKNAIALWSLPNPPEQGKLNADDWPSLRRRFLIHNPGLSGFLNILDTEIQVSQSSE
jgi:hypothetical protein